jgi:hypothetical protein
VVGGQGVLGFTERTTFGLERFSSGGIAVSTQHSNLFREFVDLGPHGIPFGGDLTQLGVKADHRVDERIKVGIATTSQRRTNSVKVGTQEPDVDHGAEASGQRSSRTGVLRANAASTSAVVSGESSVPTISLSCGRLPRR